jgi:hypothetical protein
LFLLKVSFSLGTSMVIVDPAPIVAYLPILIGATN